MAFQGTGDVESSVRDRPIPISPEKTVNIYVLIGLVRTDSAVRDLGNPRAQLPVDGAPRLLTDHCVVSYY